MRWSVLSKRRTCAIVTPQELNEGGRERVGRHQRGWCGSFDGLWPLAERLAEELDNGNNPIGEYNAWNSLMRRNMLGEKGTRSSSFRSKGLFSSLPPYSLSVHATSNR